MSPEAEEPLTTTRAEAARLVGVSLATVDHMIEDGRLRASRIVGRAGSRGRVLIHRASLNTALEATAVEVRS